MTQNNHMPSITLKDLSVEFDQSFCLSQINWQIEPGQHWAIVGPNGAGKSALAATLNGQGNITAGTLSEVPDRVAVVSFEDQAALIELERKKDDADLLDVISEGTPVREILDQSCVDVATQQRLISAFHFEELLNRSFRKLSSGETRKVMLIRAFASNPQLLILDEPFEGLDANSQQYLKNLLADFSNRIPIILVLNRFDEIPAFVTHIAYIDAGRLESCIDRSDHDAFDQLRHLLRLKTTHLSIPPSENSQRSRSTSQLKADQPLVRFRNAKVAYGDNVVFSNLNWSIEPGQHWQITGPNGSGKTCLLNLITGDHPQCYVNDIFVFGMQRGGGESIWAIKQHLGYVSSALQWEYKVSVSVRNAVISGFYDSIGIYQKYSEEQLQIADDWLALLDMTDHADQPFSRLSFGDQRMVLIARAMVKHPVLLILDEPCLGLDDINRQLILALIEKICADSETTVLYVNHRSEDRISGIEHHLAMHRE